MFPLKDNIPARVMPVANIVLMVVNLAVFIYVVAQGERAAGFMYAHGFVPARFVAASDVLFAPARLLPVFSSMFIHGSILHLVGNMWMLWIFGDNIEDVMGHGRYLLFYLLCGVIAVAAQGLAAPLSSVPMVGASGAISGVLGAYFCTYPRAKVLTLLPIFIFFYMVEVPAFFFLGLWLVLQFVQGWMHSSAATGGAGGVAWWAHVGGFAAGVLLVRYFRKKPAAKLGRGLQL